jgi:hypothetical protein
MDAISIFLTCIFSSQVWLLNKIVVKKKKKKKKKKWERNGKRKKAFIVFRLL